MNLCSGAVRLCCSLLELKLRAPKRNHRGVACQACFWSSMVLAKSNHKCKGPTVMMSTKQTRIKPTVNLVLPFINAPSFFNVDIANFLSCCSNFSGLQILFYHVFTQNYCRLVRGSNNKIAKSAIKFAESIKIVVISKMPCING